MPNNLTVSYVLTAVAVMALTTYLIRVLPMLLCRKKLKNNFLQSFLYYIPYAVLTAMTLPAIFTCTSHLWSAVAGFSAALLMAYFERSLMPVALAACGAVYVTEWLMGIY